MLFKEVREMSFQTTAKKMMKTAREKASDVIGEDGVDSLKRLGNNLRKAGSNAAEIANEVSDDCDNEILRNARNFYSGAWEKTKKGVSSSIKAAEKYSEEGSNPKTVKEDISDTGRNLGQVAKEVIKDCDNEVLRNARSFYADSAVAAQREARHRIEKIKTSAEKRRKTRAEARRRRADLRRKLTGRGAVVLISLIIILSLLVSAALWFSRRRGQANTPNTIRSDDVFSIRPNHYITESLISDSCENMHVSEGRVFNPIIHGISVTFQIESGNSGQILLKKYFYDTV